MVDNCALPKMSGMSNFPCQVFAFFETVPSAPITTGITVTFDAPWILFVSNVQINVVLLLLLLLLLGPDIYPLSLPQY